AFLGRKAISATTLNRAATAARAASRMNKESQDVGRASENVDALRQQLADLEAQFQSETAAAQAKLDPLTEALDIIQISPRKTNISVRIVTLAWAPHWQTARTATPAW